MEFPWGTEFRTFWFDVGDKSNLGLRTPSPHQFNSIQYVGIYCDFFIFMKFITHKNCLFETFRNSIHSYNYKTLPNELQKIFWTLLRSSKHHIDVNKTHLFSSKRNPLLWRPLRVSRQKTKTRKNNIEITATQTNTCSILHIYRLWRMPTNCVTRIIWVATHSLFSWKARRLPTATLYAWV